MPRSSAGAAEEATSSRSNSERMSGPDAQRLSSGQDSLVSTLKIALFSFDDTTALCYFRITGLSDLFNITREGSTQLPTTQLTP
jgi:hypothetical protein